MREIKFRGKCKWENHPRYGEWIIAPDQIDISEFWKMVEQQDGIDPSTVGQWTGLKDSKGVEIYEGDIIHNTQYPSEDWAKYIVSFDSGYFNMTDLKYHKANVGIWNVHEDCDIVGNIHDKENNNDQS